MRKASLLSALLVLSLSTMVFGHTRNGELFFAVQFPDDSVPTVDGVLDDWAAVPDSPYLIGGDLLIDFEYGSSTRGEIDVSDMSIRHFFGWNDNNNRLYAAAEVFDDVHWVDRADPNGWWNDDAWEIYIDPLAECDCDQSRSGGTGMVSYNISPPFTAGSLGVILPTFEWMDEVEDGIQWGFSYTYTGEEFGEGTYYYELWTQPYDFVAEGGDQASIIWSDLEEEQIVHMSVAFDDDDGGERTSQWISTEGGCCRANSDMVLSALDDGIDFPTAVTSDTWGRIKSRF